MSKRFAFILILIKLSPCFAQQPAYFVLGENQFKGLKVFDIIQDINHTYYFATNEGLIKYDFIKYTKLETKNAKSTSFFNLTINNKGDIFFNNLNNQIYRIRKGVCTLFYELSPSESAVLIHLNSDENGHLLVGCNGILAINERGKVIAKKTLNASVITSYQFNESTLLFPQSLSDSVILYSKGSFSSKKINSKNFLPQNYKVLKYFNFNDSTYALDLISKTLYFFDKENWSLYKLSQRSFLNSSTNARLFITGSQIWSPSPISGIKNSTNAISSHFQTYFSDYFISEVYEDHEGNILLGTFDKGVLVISDMEIPDVINPFSTDPIISIYLDKKQGLFMGSNKGSITQYKDGKIQKLTHSGKKPIEGIYGYGNSKFIFYDDVKIKYFNKETNEIRAFNNNSLKDVAFINESEMYLGTNIGLIKLRLGNSNQIKIKIVYGLQFRIYSLSYNSENKKLYSCTAKGLFQLDENGRIQEIKYLNKSIFSEKITYSQGKVYIVSNEHGIVVIDSNNTIKRIKPHLSEPKENIKKILIYNQSIIAATSDGLFQFNLNGEIMRQFHSTYGFSSKKVYNFDVSINELWVSHTGGVQQINLLNTIHNTSVPKIILKEIVVNNQPVLVKNGSEFEYLQRKFEFVFYSPTLKSRENIRYHYKLLGYDEQWQIQNFENNKVTYNALAPGTYTFVLKAENLGKFSNETSYTFTIRKPIYSQFWFLSIVVLIILAFIYLIYRWQLKVQRLKSQRLIELNLSKLTAIQSQMNPHFIFNSLNSIQDLVLQQNAPKAYDSIGKFALLIRKIMHHSEKEFIDIDEELEMITVYLEMELLRMKKDFVYTINSHGLSEIEIPPMLLQPFIENAIKHGLLHKTGEKKLEIDMQIKDSVFVCEITDNGVGRQKSAEIKERQNKLYESFSSQSLNERLAILKNHFGGNFGVEIIDLLDENQNACGTKVILNAPYKTRF